MYAEMRNADVPPVSFWSNAPAELCELSAGALRIRGLLETSASVERVFSVARWLCTDYQRVMKQETVSARVMIQSTWELAEPMQPHKMNVS
jgi:hypothetical protein